MINPRTVVEEWLAAVEAREPERVLALLSDDIELRFGASDRFALDRETLRPFVQRIRDAYESIRLEPKKVVVSDGDVALLVRVRATMAHANLSVMGEELPTADKQLDTLAALFLTISDEGTITSVTRVVDSLHVVRQLGIPAERMLSILDRLEQQLRTR